MWKRIETYIINHREELDHDVPGTEVWDRVEKALHRKNNRRRILPVWKAAAVILMAVGVGYIWYNYYPDISPPSYNYTSSILDGFRHIETGFPELEEMDSYYAMEVNQRMEKIGSYDLSQYPFIDDYMKDLEKVEDSLQEVREDLQKEGLHDPIVQALTRNHDQKLHILDLLILQLEKTEKKPVPAKPPV